MIELQARRTPVFILTLNSNQNENRFFYRASRGHDSADTSLTRH